MHSEWLHAICDPKVLVITGMNVSNENMTYIQQSAVESGVEPLIHFEYRLNFDEPSRTFNNQNLVLTTTTTVSLLIVFNYV